MDFKDTFWSLRKLRNARLKGAGALAHSMTAKLANKGSWLLDFKELAEGHKGNEEAYLEPSNELPAEALNEVKPTEKAELLESFANFAKDKTSEKEEKKIIFPGGELEVAKSDKEKTTEVEMKEELSPYILKRDLHEGVDLQLLFLGEVPKDFEGEDNDLLSKMIGAMNLEKGSFARAFIPKLEDEDEIKKLWGECASDIYQLRPKAVVSLGAFATNLVLAKKERLSKIHGKEFPLSLKGQELFSSSVFPVFHPDILNINPNMKRSAWMDLQEIMKFLVS